MVNNMDVRIVPGQVEVVKASANRTGGTVRYLHCICGHVCRRVSREQQAHFRKKCLASSFTKVNKNCFKCRSWNPMAYGSSLCLPACPPACEAVVWSVLSRLTHAAALTTCRLRSILFLHAHWPRTRANEETKWPVATRAWRHQQLSKNYSSFM